MKWTEASSSVIKFAENLIENFHPILKEARIAFVFREKAQKQGERYILGQCTKVPEKFQPYLEYDYIIWLSEEDYAEMDDLRREALIDHELCHCKFSGQTGTWGIRPHDIQEFSDVIERHGIWSPDIRRIKSAIEKYEAQTLPGLLVDSMEKFVNATGKIGADSVTLSSNGKVVTLSGEELDRAAKALAE